MKTTIHEKMPANRLVLCYCLVLSLFVGVPLSQTFLYSPWLAVCTVGVIPACLVFQFVWNRPVISATDGVLTFRSRLCFVERCLSDCTWSFTRRPRDHRLIGRGPVIQIEAIAVRDGIRRQGPIVYCGFDDVSRLHWEQLLTSSIGKPHPRHEHDRISVYQKMLTAPLILISIVAAVAGLAQLCLVWGGAAQPVRSCVVWSAGVLAAIVGVSMLMQHQLIGIQRWFLVTCFTVVGLISGVLVARVCGAFAGDNIAVLSIAMGIGGHIIGWWSGTLAKRDAVNLSSTDVSIGWVD